MTSAGDPTEVDIVGELKRRGWTLATAESLTGGLLAQCITSVPGASAVFTVGWVTYATAQKTARLGVPPDLIERHGVVSSDVALAMVEGALERSGADFALATTGAAGPDPLSQPGHDPVPVGHVWTAAGHVRAADGDRLFRAADHEFAGTRDQIRAQTVEAAFSLLLQLLDV